MHAHTRTSARCKRGGAKARTCTPMYGHAEPTQVRGPDRGSFNDNTTQRVSNAVAPGLGPTCTALRPSFDRPTGPRPPAFGEVSLGCAWALTTSSAAASAPCGRGLVHAVELGTTCCCSASSEGPCCCTSCSPS